MLSTVMITFVAAFFGFTLGVMLCRCCMDCYELGACGWVDPRNCVRRAGGIRWPDVRNWLERAQRAVKGFWRPDVMAGDS